jgi:rhomboid protease GluP
LNKVNYLNAITIDLIKFSDCVPKRSPRGGYVIGDKVRFLEKLDIGTYSAIQIINGDLFSPYEFRTHLEKSINYLKTFKHNNVEVPELILILAYSYSPEPAVYNMLRQFDSDIDAGELKIFICELLTANIRYMGLNRPFEIYTILSERMNSDLTGYETLGDLERHVIAEHPQERFAMPAYNPVATYVIAAINAAVFILGFLIQAFSGENIIYTYGIKSWFKIVNGEYWRFITPIFLHAGAAHLATNTLSLIIFGRALEGLFGAKKFLTIYIASGIAGNIASFAFTPNNSLGASGAILGLGGALLYLWKRNRTLFTNNRQQYMTLLFMVVFNLFYGFTQPSIDNFAHLGGAICGFLVAGILGCCTVRESNSKRFMYFMMLVFLGILCMVIGFTAFMFYRFI